MGNHLNWAMSSEQIELVETGSHAAGIASLAYLPSEGKEGQTIITAGGDGVVHFHDASNITRDPSQTLDCEGALLNVVVNHEGELIATADEGGTVSLFKRSNDGTFKTDRDVTRFTLPARALDFSADDRFLASSGDDGIIRIYNVMDRSAATEMQTDQPVKSVSYDPRDMFLAVYLANGTVYIYDAEQQYELIFEMKDVAPKTTPDSSVLGKMSWYPGSGKHLAVPAGDAIRVLIRESWTESYSLQGAHKHQISSVAYCPNGKYLISADEASVVVWDILKRSALITQMTRAPVSGMSWNPHCNELAMVNMDGFLFLGDKAIPTNMDPPAGVKEAGPKVRPEGVDVIEHESLEEEKADAEEELADVDEGLDDWLEDDDGEYKKELDAERTQEDAMIEEVLGKEAPALQLSERQAAFQPGSSADLTQKRRFLAWNLIGQIVTRNEDSYHTVEIEFSDTTTGRPVYIRDHRAFNLGSMDSFGAFFASAEQGSNASVISYKPFREAFSNSEWSKELPTGETPLVVAVSKKWRAVATSKQMVRVFSTYGSELGMFCLSGPIVSMNANGDQLAVVCHGVQPIEGQNLEYTLYDVEAGNRMYGDTLPVTPGSKLSWIGYTMPGTLSIVDSEGSVRVLMEHKGWQWMPVLEMAPLCKTANDKFWVVGVTEDHVMAVMCPAGRTDPITHPRPLLDALQIQIPLLLPDEKSGALEHEVFLKQLTMDFEDHKAERDGEEKDNSKMVLQIDIKMLQLMQMLMKSNKEGRAFELACMLQTTKMLQNSIQLAHANNLNTLAERLEQLLEQKLEPEQQQQQQQAVAA